MPTGLPVELVFSVEAMHALQQLPLFAAARVVDKVPGEDFLQLANRQPLNGVLVVQIGQRGADPPLRGRDRLRRARRLLQIEERHAGRVLGLLRGKLTTEQQSKGQVTVGEIFAW